MNLNDFNLKIINYVNSNKTKKNFIILDNTKKINSNKLNLIKSENCYFKILGGLKNIKDKPRYRKRVTYNIFEMRQIIGVIESIENNLPATKEEKLIYIYNYIRKNLIYSPEEDNDKNIRSLYCLVTKKAVCSGYALVLKELLDRQSIKCQYIKYLNHAWNNICINRKWYEVDVTWDSCIYHKIPNSNLHYFANNKNLSEKHFNYTHVKNQYKNDILNEYKFTTFRFVRDDKTTFDLSLLPIGYDRKYYLYKEKSFVCIVSCDDDFEAIIAEYNKNIVSSYINCFFTNERIKRNISNNLSYIGYGYFKNNCFYRKGKNKIDRYIKQIKIKKNQITIETIEKVYIIKNKNLMEVKVC